MAACLAGSYAIGQSFPPAWNSSSTYVAGDIVQYGGNWYRAMAALGASGPYPASAYGKWELNYVRSNTTLTIGDRQAFANLQYAWQFARNARIADAAYLHLSIVTSSGDFTENFTAPFSLDHGSGALISIIGDNRANILLDFYQEPSNGNFLGTNGFVIDGGHSFGTISGFLINDVPSGTLRSFTPGQQGITLFNGASISNLENVAIGNGLGGGFGTGVYASQQASISISSSTTINCSSGLVADFGASILAGGVSITSNSGSAVYADHNATISNENAQFSNPSFPGTGAGVVAFDGGFVDAKGCTIGGSTPSGSQYNYGCQVENGGRANVENVTFGGNTNDIYADLNGVAYAQGASTPDGNSVDSSNGAFIFT